MSYRGKFIVLVGPDGTGKTTVAQAIREMQGDRYAGIHCFHWRPGLLPVPGRRTTAADTGQAGAPPRDFKYGTMLSLLRFFYYLTDFVLGYWLEIRPRLRRGELVIGERWYYDVIVHPQRYAFRLPTWLLNAGGLLVPGPDISILLYGDPDKIHARKPELSADEISQYISALRKVLPRPPGSMAVATDGSLEDTRQAIETGLQDGGANGTQEWWTAFPSRTRPRVLIGPHDRIRNGLALYQAYSLKARLLKQALRMLPEGIARRLLPGIERSALPPAVAGALGTAIADDSLPNTRISAYVGSTSSNLKITLQISSTEGVCYTKCATGDTAKSALRNEANALSLLEGKAPGSIEIPRLLGRPEDQHTLCICTSSPQQAIRKRGTRLGSEDIRFVNWMAGFGFSDDPIGHVPLPETSGSGHSRQAVEAAGQALATLFGDAPVRQHYSHGDYAPWNTLLLQDGRLFVFDWEYFRPKRPAFHDLLHFLYMPSRLLVKAPPASTARLLLEAPAQALGRGLYADTRFPEETLPGYVILYLLAQMARDQEEQGDTAYTLDCLRAVMDRIGAGGARRRILVSAYACEPGKGSEPGVGWNWVQEISRNNEVWVLTRGNNAPAIEKALSDTPQPNLHFEYVDVPRWLSFWKRGQRGVRTYYYLWQFAALKRARKLDREQAFDIGHHVTFVNDWLWTFLALMPIPYIWGPVGSHPKSPRCLLANRRARVHETLRNLIQVTMRCIDPLYWLSGLRAKRVVAINAQTAGLFPLRLVAGHKTVIEPAIGMETVDMVNDPERGDDRFEVLFVGRFAPVKAPHLVVEAFADFLALDGCKARLTMIGSGGERPEIGRRIRRYGITEHVEVLDWMQREEVIRRMRESDVFLFPSMECGGMVVLEAMACGLPVVCLDFGGPGTMVTTDCGIKVAVGDCDTDRIRSELAAGLASLTDDKLRQKMSAAARERVMNRYSWTCKGTFADALYSEVLDSRNGGPRTRSSHGSEAEQKCHNSN